MYALQIDFTSVDAEEVAASPLGPVLVAVAKHLARANGSWHAIELGDDSYMDAPDPPQDWARSSAGRPKIEEVPS
jgi:hypothetical protein